MKSDRQNLVITVLLGVALGLAGYVLAHAAGVESAPTALTRSR